MRTEKQIAASRANGAKSKGPRSPRRESQRHPVPAHATLAGAIVHHNESVAIFQELESMMHAALLPQNPLEHMAIGRIVAAHWHQVREWKLSKAQARELAANQQEYLQAFGQGGANPQQVPRLSHALAAQRMGAEFYRAIYCFFRIRKLTSQPIQPTEPNNFLKTFDTPEPNEPAENPSQTQQARRYTFPFPSSPMKFTPTSRLPRVS